MKITVTTAELSRMAGLVQGTIPLRPPVPITTHVLLEACAGELLVHATDLTLTTSVSGEAAVDEEGGVVLSGRRFFQMARDMLADTMRITAEEGETVLLSGGTARFALHGLRQNTFPELPNPAEAETISLDGEQLRTVLYKALASSARYDDRQILNTVMIRLEEDTGTFFGADGRRLSRVTIEMAAKAETKREYVLPRKAVEEMVKMLHRKEKVDLLFFSDKIGIKTGSGSIVTLLVSGRYPAVELIIPSDPATIVPLHREELMSLLKQFSIFVEGDGVHGIRFILEEGELTLEADRHDIGSGRVTMPADHKGEPFTSVYDPVLFYELLRQSSDETVSFSFFGPSRPAMITDSTTAKFVLMPMRISQESPPHPSP
ncbi:MAG: DNA polymerase III subunit beta [Simkaniaceae bacterium]|nr:DNA polymerase III subunit beta [Simkaniaceae bacterium]